MVKCTKITLDFSGALKWVWSLYSCQDYLYPVSLICLKTSKLPLNCVNNSLTVALGAT